MALTDFVREAPPISVDAEDAFVDIFRDKQTITKTDLTRAFINSTGGGVPIRELDEVVHELIEAGLLRSRSVGSETLYTLTPQGVRLHSLLDS
jgi:predicted transcriptional regulator